ncbi:MAG: DUF4907 domain-containing protein [Bacteroidetes bacterium]|nr:DUF4907 domain-containing protein [Bacteroidota bacterium]
MKKFFILPVIIFFFACSSGSVKNKKETADSSSVKKPEQAMTPQEKEMQEMKEMAEKQKKQPQENPYKNAKIEVKIIDNTKSKNADDVKVSGFGYDIYIFDALYVHQPNVPAINGNRGFKTKEQAKNAGELVAYKIKNNIMPPSVTIQELDSLGVLK